MLYRKLDNNSDYVFGHGSDDYISDVDAVAQAVKTRLLLLLGEWWEDLDDGLALFQTILQQRNTPAGRLTIDTVVRERIAGTEGLTQIVTYTGEPTRDNGYRVEAEVLTEFSEYLQINEELEV